MAAHVHNRYLLGEFELDADRYLLKNHNKQLHLAELPFQVLLFLVDNRDRYVSRQELLERFWSGSDSYEETLTKCISTIRTQLNDPPTAPRFIETRKKVGYRYIGPCDGAVAGSLSTTDNTLEVETTRVLSVVIDEQEDLPESVSAAGFNQPGRQVEPLLLQTGSDRNTRKVILTTSVVLVVLSLGLLFYLGQRAATGSGSNTINSIAVIPFKELSDAETEDHFSDGITESLVMALSKIDGLRVISNSSVARFKGGTVDPQALGRQLNVSAVLEGTVRKDGDRVLVTMQVASAEDGRILWASNTYDRNAKNIFGLQEEIAHDVVDGLRFQLSEEKARQSSRKQTSNSDAYRAYLQGRFWVDKRNVEGGLKAIECFNQAIERDPNYALAYIGLADSYGQLHDLNYLAPKEAIAKEKDAVLKALAIDDNLAEAHTEMGAVLAWLDWDFKRAEREYKRGIELNPNSPRAHHWYRGYLTIMGRHSEALAEEQRALELDPASVRYVASIGWVLYYGRRYNEALIELQKALEMDRTFEPALEWLALTYLKLDRHPEAISALEEAVKLHPEIPTLQAHLGGAYARAGRGAEARKLLAGLEKLSTHRYVNPYDMAIIYTGLGDKDRAFEYLYKALEAHSSHMAQLKVEPQLDSLRSDIRFQDLMRRVGLTR